MKYTISLLTLAFCLTGCSIGTQVVGRDVEIEKPFPDLHTVPDRPQPKDFSKIDVEREDFETDHETKMELNQEIRQTYKAPEREAIDKS